jgi:hypothetical protein
MQWQLFMPANSLVEFHILIDALDCPALGHPAPVRAVAGTVALTTANDVFLDTVQGDRKIFGPISIYELDGSTMTFAQASGESTEVSISKFVRLGFMYD